MSCEIEIQDDLLKEYAPKLDESKKKLDLSIPEEDIKKVSLYVLNKYPVIDFSSDLLPIENVMKTIMKNPEILKTLGTYV